MIINNIKNIIFKFLRLFGFKPSIVYNYNKYRKDLREWIHQGGVITEKYPIKDEYYTKAGVHSGQYFHQDLLVASYIFNKNPKRHIDIGSRIDGFVAHVASFRKIEVFDIRDTTQSVHKNMIFHQVDMMENSSAEITDSLSCLHAIEHFGLGRYGDTVDITGHIKGIDNLIAMLKKDGILYISFPIGKKDEVYFNAHRIFHPNSFLHLNSVKESLLLQQFDYIDNYGDLHINANLTNVIDKLLPISFGCGIYTFKKK